VTVNLTQIFWNSQFRTRIDLQQTPQSIYQEGTARPKYVVPKTKKQKEFLEKNRPYTYKQFCKYESVKMAEPLVVKKVSDKVN